MALTLAQANQIIAAALARSNEAGHKPMAIVVLDDGGHIKSAQREDGASMFRTDIAMGKAWASIAMGAASRVLTQRAKDLPAFFVNSAQASRHQLVARPASTLRDSTTVPVVASSIARSLLAVT